MFILIIDKMSDILVNLNVCISNFTFPNCIKLSNNFFSQFFGIPVEYLDKEIIIGDYNLKLPKKADILICRKCNKKILPFCNNFANLIIYVNENDEKFISINNSNGILLIKQNFSLVELCQNLMVK